MFAHSPQRRGGLTFYPRLTTSFFVTKKTRASIATVVIIQGGLHSCFGGSSPVAIQMPARMLLLSQAVLLLMSGRNRLVETELLTSSFNIFGNGCWSRHPFLSTTSYNCRAGGSGVPRTPHRPRQPADFRIRSSCF